MIEDKVVQSQDPFGRPKLKDVGTWLKRECALCTAG